MSDANTDLEKYINTYFIKRNGIEYTPIKDVGYTPVTLAYMPSAPIADKITKLIIKYQRELGNIPFDIYDASGGIGGSTLSFLDNPEVKHVYTYEIVPERRAMEKVNVEAYNLQNKWTSFAEYTGTPNDAVGSVTYFDPPWLPHSTGLDFKKSDYIQENTEYAGYTLEQWLGKLPQCALVVFRLPPGYRFKPVTGWRIDISDDLHKVKKNVRLIVCVNLSYPKVTGENKINIEPVVANQSIFNVIKPEKKKFTLFNAPKESAYTNNKNSSYQNNNNSSYQNNNNSSYQNNNNSSYQNNKNSSYQNNSNSSYQNKNNSYNRNNPSSPLNELPFTSNNNSSSSTYSSSTRQPYASGRERYNKNENTKRSQSPEFKPSSNFIPVVAPKLLATFGIPETVLTTSIVRSIEMEQQIVIDNKDEKIIIDNKDETPEQKQKWSDDLKNFLIKFLGSWIESTDIITNLLNEKNFKTWKLGFTTDSYDPFDNYDVLEKLGDAIMKATFTEYIMDRFEEQIDSGKINERGISNLVIEYTSKIRQAEISSTIGLPNHVRINKNLSVSVHISEDLFESLYGAIFKTGNNIKKGLGYILAYNMTKYIFDPIDILTAYLYDPSKTFVTQTFSSLGWGNSPKIIKSKINDKYTFDIYFTEAAYNYLKVQGIDVPAKIGSAVAASEAAAEKAAFSKSVENMTKYGITNEWISAQKFNKEFNDVIHPEIASYMDSIRDKMKKNDLVRISFDTLNTNLGNNVRLLQLKGYKYGYQKLILLGSELIFTEVKGSTFTEKHLDLLRKFIES